MSVTGDGLLEDKLQKILKTENEELLRGFIHNTLAGNRPHAVAFFQKAIASIQGKQRFKILEVLMEDAGTDLIPLMIYAIKQEKNVLFAKSLLFLYGNFDQAEALEALMELESSVHSDLQKSYQKVAGKLKARFRELFYISEFRAGDKNAKRMSHAAEMMVKEPHESYAPFLNGVLREGPLQLRKVACKVLAALGDGDSLDTLTLMMPVLFHDRSRTQSLALYLQNESTYENPKLGDVLGMIGMLGEWTEDEVQQRVNEIRGGNIFGTLNQIKATLLPDETLMTQDIYRFLDSFFSAGTPPKSEIRRVERLFSEHVEVQTGLLQEAFVAMGAIGHRLAIEGLTAQMEALIPQDTPDAQELCAAFLGGYQSPESMTKLLALLVPGQNPALGAKVLAALNHYTLDSLPECLARIAGGAEDGLMRQAAMNLIARAGMFDQVLDDLLANPSLIVQVDAIQTVAAFQLSAGYDRLLAQLATDINPRLQEVIITALEAFPDDRTGISVRPFLNLPHTYLIRFAALKTMILAGGSQRIAMLVETIGSYPEKHRSEMLGSFLKLLGLEPPPELFDYLALWRVLLDDDKYASLRMLAFQMLEKVDWTQVDGPKWIDFLNGIIEKPEAQRSSQENKALRIYVLRIRAILEQGVKVKVSEPAKDSTKAHTLEGLLEQIELANLHERVRIFRMLNLHFKPEWYQAGEPNADKLVGMVENVLCNSMEMPDLFKTVLTLVAKLNLPHLTELAGQRLESLDPELAEYGRKVLHLDTQPIGHPVQSILILDDTSLIGKTLQRYLIKSGFAVHTETHPEEAIAVLGRERYDLLLLDVLMPGMNGYQFIAETRRRGLAPANVLMMTSSRERELLQQAAGLGIDGMLLKPFPIQDLLDKIQNLRCV